MEQTPQGGRGGTRDRKKLNRRAFLAIGAAMALTPLPAAAGTVEDFFIKELKAQGYTEFETGYTWLRRLRIVALSPTYRREIIVNPRTGEILRDFWVRRDGGDGSADLLVAEPSGSSGDGSSGGSGGGNGGNGGSGGSGGGNGGAGSGGGNAGHGSGDDGGESGSEHGSGDGHGKDDHGGGDG